MSVIFILMSISSMSHVDFKKCPCRPVDFKGQGPSIRPLPREKSGGSLPPRPKRTLPMPSSEVTWKPDMEIPIHGLTVHSYACMLEAFHLVCTQFYMLSGPPSPLFACNMQWKCIGGLTPPTPTRCVCTKWKAP